MIQVSPLSTASPSGCGPTRSRPAKSRSGSAHPRAEQDVFEAFAIERAIGRSGARTSGDASGGGAACDTFRGTGGVAGDGSASAVPISSLGLKREPLPGRSQGASSGSIARVPDASKASGSLVT